MAQPGLCVGLRLPTSGWASAASQSASDLNPLFAPKSPKGDCNKFVIASFLKSGVKSKRPNGAARALRGFTAPHLRIGENDGSGRANPLPFYP
jgi:hypothetical protein